MNTAALLHHSASLTFSEGQISLELSRASTGCKRYVQRIRGFAELTLTFLTVWARVEACPNIIVFRHILNGDLSTQLVPAPQRHEMLHACSRKAWHDMPWSDCKQLTYLASVSGPADAACQHQQVTQRAPLHINEASHCWIQHAGV
jgi:hypothetical protein